MIGRVVFSIDDEPYEAVLDDEGNWTSSLPEIAAVFNDVFPADGSIHSIGENPTDGRFGEAALRRAAEDFDGKVDFEGTVRKDKSVLNKFVYR